jgi:hypothetical protein
MGCVFDTFERKWGPGLGIALAPKPPPYIGDIPLSAGSMAEFAKLFPPDSVSCAGLFRTLLELSCRVEPRASDEGDIPFLFCEVSQKQGRHDIKMTVGFYRYGGDLFIDGGLLFLSENSRQRGIGRQIVTNLAEIADCLGAVAIQFHAGMSVGGYAWATFGGVPTEPDALRGQLLTRLASMSERRKGEAGANPNELEGIEAMRAVITSTQYADNPFPGLLSNPSIPRHMAKELLLGAEWSGLWEPGNQAHRDALRKALFPGDFTAAALKRFRRILEWRRGRS